MSQLELLPELPKPPVIEKPVYASSRLAPEILEPPNKPGLYGSGEGLIVFGGLVGVGGSVGEGVRTLGGQNLEFLCLLQKLGVVAAMYSRVYFGPSSYEKSSIS